MPTEMEQTEPTFRRLWEVDTVRGIGVILMICYHLVFDLSYFGAYSGNVLSVPWQIFARGIGSTFIFVMGISLTLRYNRLRPKLDPGPLFRKYLWRGVQLLGWGMVITVVTHFVLDRGFVIFGILHLLGLSTILAYPFLRSRWASLVAAIVVIWLGIYIDGFVSPDPWLLWLGVKQMMRYMVDYYPVLPWSGVALLGIFVGYTLYPSGRARFALPDLSHAIPIRGLTYLGKHSLAIYLIHQPILLAFLILVGIGSI